MKIFESKHEFLYPWEQVTAANWQKYPNELSTHVVSVDILHREIDSQKQVLRTERLIACKQPVPKWLSVICGSENYSYVREVSEVDLINKTLVMKSHNLTMNHIVQVNETVVYKPDDTLANSRTLFLQQAEITAFGSFKKICDKIEDWSVERFGQNAKIGKQGFESVLQTLTSKWQDSGVLVQDVSNSVTETTTGVLAEVTKLGNVFRDN